MDKYIYNCVNDTDCCVLTIATSLFEHNITPIVLTNYCQSNGGETAHITGIKCLERLIGKKQIVDKKLTRKEELYNI